MLRLRIIMESGPNPSFKRSLTTVSTRSNRPSVATSWLKNLLNSGSESPVNSPAKSEMPRRSVNFDFESSKSPEVSSWIKNFNPRESNSPNVSTNLALQLVKAQKSLPISSWVSGLISKSAETPELKVQKLVEKESESLNQWVNEIADRTDPPKDEKYKDQIKGAICSIVDNAFGTEEINQDADNEEKQSTPRFVYDVCLAEQVEKRITNKPANFKQNIKLQRAEEAINAFPELASSRKTAPSQKKPRRENPSFSEFGATPLSYTFSKQPRHLDFAHKQSPGPAQYTAGRSSLNAKPVAFFPTDKTARDFYLEPLETPGPAEYNPAKHFISK